MTIVFSYVESSTVLLDRLGDTGFLRMLAWPANIVRNAADEHRGYVVKSHGDGFMARISIWRIRSASKPCDAGSDRRRL